MKKVYSILSFILAITTLFFYLVSVNRGVNPHLAMFWSPIVVIVIIVLYQITNIREKDSFFEKILLLEIFLMTVVFHLIFVIPVPMGLRGWDSHYDYYAAKMVMEYGWPVPRDIPLLLLTRTYLQWPMIHHLAAITSEITGIDLFLVARWFPSFYSSFALPLFYIFTKSIYGDERTALLASFGFSAIYMYINWHCIMLRESLAFVIFLATLYSFTKAQIAHEIKFVILGFFFSISLTFTHHLTSFVSMLFSMALLILPNLFTTTILNHSKITGKTSLRLTKYIFLFTFVSTMAYLMHTDADTHVLTGVISTIIKIPLSGFGIYQIYSHGAPTRVVVSAYGNSLILLAFGTLILTHLFREKCKKIREDVTLSIFVTLFFAISLSYIFVEILASSLEVTRFQVFYWPFMLIVSAHAITKNKKRNILSLLFAIFIILQIFTIPPNVYNHSFLPDYEFGRLREYYLPQEYAAVSWFNFSGEVIGDQTVRSLLGGLRQVEVTVPTISKEYLNLPKGYLMVYRRENSFYVPGVPWTSEGFFKITLGQFDKTKNKVYSNGEVMIYK